MGRFIMQILSKLYYSPGSVNPVNVPRDWITVHGTCRSAMRRQIQMEVKASLQYLAMGAHFSRDGLFFDAASEEREHAMKLIDYLLMRGELTHDVTSLIKIRLADYLTGEFLEEQYKGQRDLAGKATTLKKMLDRHSALGEFLFDKKLLGMDI
ncbi:hypothetical protein MSG28_014498 [Choristoneura fumiferana]|uniref:Uncharacterized protein n=1 Tax=Choristoneura fumiferana TaxID=7141 RepID=A0ACC0JRM7_CHOFU|nr:hypothetical protein MSG28_014498 [Choristoneura fumiferana]